MTEDITRRERPAGATSGTSTGHLEPLLDADQATVLLPKWTDQLAPDRSAELDLEVDPWAWVAEAEDAVDEADLSSCQVTAVLVTLDAEDWLPETLAGLNRLRRRPTRLIALDNASRDSTRALLDRAREQGLVDAVYDGGKRRGFGASVAKALELDKAELELGKAELDDADLAPPSPQHSFLWFLHDDAVPAPDALDRLLTHLVADPSVDVTGPKLLFPRRRRMAPQLGEIGVSISGTGRRELMIDPGEIDQGQRDQPQERLGVSTCGMLVRAEIFTALGGFDPAIPVFRDGVEFGWRAHLHGYRVVTTPSARFSHREVGRAGLRPGGAAGRRPGVVDRRLGMLVVIGHARTLTLPWVWIRLVWSCLLHAVGYLLGKAPGRARDELVALGSFVAHPSRIARFRRRTKALATVAGAPQVVKRLRPPWWNSVRVAIESITGAVSERYRTVAGEVDVASLDELTGDDFAATTTDETSRNPWFSPAVLITVLAVIGSLIAARGLIGLGSLSAPALLPAPQSLGALWQEVLAPIAGAPGQSAPPWLALMALGSTIVLGQPEWFVTLLLCAVVPASLLAVYPVLRHLVANRRLRVWAASTYALLPVLIGGTNQGRLSLCVAAVVLPMLVLAARALVLRRPRLPEAWRGGWGAGVALTVLVAFEPSVLVLALLLGIAGAIALRRQPRKVGRIGIAVGLPILALAPWWPTVLTNPGRLFVGPDAAAAGAGTAPPALELLLGRENGGGLPPLWLSAIVFGVIWVLALIGLLRRGQRPLVRAAFVTALVALALAVVLSRSVVTLPPVGADARPWTGVQLLIAFGALIVAGAAGADQLGRDIASRSFSWLQPLSVLAAVVVALASLAGGAWWVLAGATGPIQRQQTDALPPYVRNAMTSPAGVRVLAVQLDGNRAQFAVLADDGIRLGDADRGYTFGGSQQAGEQAEDLVLRLVAGTADSDIGAQLRDLGIAYVWVRGASEEQQSRIDNTPGLGSASGSLEAVVWQVQPAGSRRSVVAESTVTPVQGDPIVVPDGAPNRTLRIGEAADPRWRATLTVNGVSTPLSATSAGWQQTFVLPAQGGSVAVWLPSAQPWWLIAQGVLLLVAGVLAAPGIRRPEVRDPTKTARRAASIGGSL